MSVALLTDHRSVEDWPRSIRLGSAEKLLMLGFAGGGGAAAGGAGGGGAGGGTFFLQPALNNKSMQASKTAPAFI